jgi:prepilin-type N-terminal cleavage/methylation domain-containing protein
MTNHLRNAPDARLGFTLVELMVVIVIISILSSLMLAGLAGVRQRAKIEKTKSTIRKIHEIVMPQYESYTSRRVSATGSDRVALAKFRLEKVRRLLVTEMPDNWIDVQSNTATTAGARAIKARHSTLNAPGSRFATVRDGETDLSKTYGNLYANAETLFCVVSLGGVAADALEAFRSDEIGDVDGDKAPEFFDGWNRPIMFIRWPAAFSKSIIQSGDPALQPDPLDPQNISGVSPPSPPHDWLTIPLIYSGGPDNAAIDPLGTDDGFGIKSTNTFPPSTSLSTVCYGNQAGSITSPTAERDNIYNHDLMSKR